MKIKLDRSRIQSALKRVIGAVPQSSTMEIMTHLMVSVKDGRALWTGGRAEAQISVRTDVDADADGDFTLPARKFGVLLSGLQGSGDITMDVTGGVTTLRAGRSKYTLNGLDPSLYPVQKIETKFGVTMSAPELSAMMTYSAPCMNSGNDPRLFTMGEYLDFGGEQINVISTDGVRLGFANKAMQTDKGGILINRDAVSLVLGVLSAAETAWIGGDDRKFRLVVGDYELVGSQIDTKYFDYSRWMGMKRDYVKVEAAELKAAVIRMIGFADNVGRCEIAIRDGEIKLRAGNAGEADEVVMAEGGINTEINLPLGQVKDVLDVSTGETIEIGVSTSHLDPVIWRESEASGRFTIMSQLRS